MSQKRGPLYLGAVSVVMAGVMLFAAAGLIARFF
jgi:hypothetical protein